jgi:hypothetical protein
VQGDHDTYESGLQRYPGKPRSIMAWACGCPWASWHQDKSYPGRLNGRPCSHVWALQLEATARQSRRENRGQVPTDQASSNPYGEVIVKSLGPWTSDGWAQQWSAPATRYPVAVLAHEKDLHGEHPAPAITGPGSIEVIPLREAAGILRRTGVSRGDIKTLTVLAAGLRSEGCHVCEDGSDEMDSAAGTCHNCGRKIASIQVRADQANAPWGGQSVPKEQPQPTYGATEPPQPDMDPAQYGPLVGPDPENWGSIDDSSIMQMPMSTEGALDRVECSECGGQVEGTSGPGTSGHCRSCGREMAIPRFRGMRQDKAYPVVHEDPVNVDPGRSAYDDSFLHEHGIEAALHEASATDVMVSPTYISPQPRNESGVAEWHEDQGSFPYVDHDNTAGPSTSMTPRDPQGIRMEEALQRALAEVTAAAAGVPMRPRGDEPPDEAPHPKDCDCTHCEYNRYHTKHSKPVYASVDQEQPELMGGLGAELHDEPEGALDPEGLTGGDTPMGGGDACSGTMAPSAADVANLGEFGAARRAEIRARLGFGQAPQYQVNPAGQYALDPQASGGGPGMSQDDEDLTPNDQSIQTIGQQQWSGAGADSDEVAVPAGEPSGSEAQIVAAFQASAAAKHFAGGGGATAGDGDIAARAREFLKTGVLSDAEAGELIDEGKGTRARNLDLLDVTGTHYEAEAAQAARRGLDLDDFEDDLITI